jgi:hypothetical protein
MDSFPMMSGMLAVLYGQLSCDVWNPNCSVCGQVSCNVWNLSCSLWTAVLWCLQSQGPSVNSYPMMSGVPAVLCGQLSVMSGISAVLYGQLSCNAWSPSCRRSGHEIPHVNEDTFEDVSFLVFPIGSFHALQYVRYFFFWGGGAGRGMPPPPLVFCE